MIKKIAVISLLVLLGGALLFGAVNRTLAKNNTESGAYGQEGGGNRGGQQASLSGLSDRQVDQNGQGNQGAGKRGTGNGCDENGASDSQELSSAEIDGLFFMIEEEKLARDVYASLYTLWDEEVFLNIRDSEQAHLEAIEQLLIHYELPNAISVEAGVFINPELQTLYNELIVRGGQSLADALKVGATIEEKDILDLEEWLAQTSHKDIQRVYENLLNGSQNHLRAFTSTLLTRYGETYQPQYLSLEVYQSILSTSTRQGQGGREGGGGYRGGRP